MNNKLFNKSSITKNWKWWVSIPFIFVLIALIVFTSFAVKEKDAGKGMNIGIDFAGGSVVTIILGDGELGNSEGFNKHLTTITEVIKDENIAQQVVDKASENGVTIDKNSVIGKISYSQKSDSGDNMAIMVKFDNISKAFDPESEYTNMRNNLIVDQLKSIYSEENGYNGITPESEFIGATASAELIRTALISVAITLVLILIYIIIRFEIWSGLAAIIGLMHDVLIMVCLTIIFRIQVNSAFIAAMITIVAYSINNTIVVFDRVRENVKDANQKNKRQVSKIDNNEKVDIAVKETLMRSINSTVTTMVAIVFFAILGASTVREFALPVIFGLIAGFYSSLCLAPSLYCLMKNAADSHKRNKIIGTSKKSKKEKKLVGQE